MADFTKGEWGVDKDGNVMARDGRLIATVSCHTPALEYTIHLTENIANAHLIAAAPDQNVALSNFVEWYKARGFDRGLPEFQRAQQALTKAEGE